MTGRRARTWAAYAWLLLLYSGGHAAAQDAPPGTGTLRLVVKDQTAGVIPGATVQIAGAERANEAVVRSLWSDGQGTAVAQGLRPGRYLVEVRFPGFETLVIPDLRVRAGDNRREVILAIQKLDEDVLVGRDPATSASDPNSDRFGHVLSREQIDALPDDPEEMERVLEQMAGPGATIRVDGFRGGRLPPKSQIRSIRFASGMFAAEHHGGGMTIVDIVTQPGVGPLRGGVDFTFRDGALNARNAFQPEKGPERTQQYAFNLSGTLLKDRTSFALSAGGASLYDSANIFAALADGTRAVESMRRPTDRVNLSARLDHALTRSHMLRGSYMQADSNLRNLGVGGFELPDRAFGRMSHDRILRLSESGPWGRLWFAESRLQLRWTGSDSTPAVDAPAVRVLDAFTTGGAQQAGGRRGREIEWATTIDWARGRHAVRMGSLVEGGWYRSDGQTNYLGTYTFASLEDFAAASPSTFTQRTGNPLVEYSHWQAGFFVQDDWRARRNLTLSAGLRQEFQTQVGDGLNLAPRGGFTWAPFSHGRTTIRGGGGIFYDWLESEVYEQTLRVDGVRQQETVVLNPGYPDPFSGGSAQVLPSSKYLLADGLILPRRAMASLGVSRQLSPAIVLNVNMMAMNGSNRFRGRNVNAPLHGVRPDPTLGNVTQVESTARMRSRQVNTGLSISVPSRRAFVFANYTFVDQWNDADGPFALPADSHDLAAEWAPAAALPRHTASAVLNLPIGSRVRIGLTTIARSGTRYTVTTGRDDNGDAVFNDRPAGVGRNTALGHGMWDVAARVGYTFGFGNRPPASGGPPRGQGVIVQRGAGSAGDLLGAMAGGGAEDKRIRIELFASAQNLLNTVTPIGYSGVMTSPFFGQPTAAMPGRRIDLGMRVGF
jgi:hypothetical protein